MKNKILYFIALWASLAFFSGLAQSASDLYELNAIKSTEIVLPGQSPGKEDDTFVDVFVPNVDARFPMVILLQGGLVEGNQYSTFGKLLARQGFLVAIPNRLTFFAPGTPPVPFPDQLVVLETLAQLEIENSDPFSDLYRQVDTERLGLAGHSVGGFVGLLVIEGSCLEPFCFGFFQRPAALKAGAFYGTSSIDPFSGQLIDIDTYGIPVALVQGTQDGVTTTAEAKATFAILEDPRKYIEIKGANHYGPTNDNPPKGAIPDFSPQLISQNESINQIANAIGDFFYNRIFGLSVSKQSDRSSDLPLKEQNLSGDAYIFLTPLYPPTKIKKVTFYLDDRFIKTELYPPYDLRGTTGKGTAARFDTRWLANGHHNLQADILFSSGELTSISTTFSVLNKSSDDDDDDEIDDDD